MTDAVAAAAARIRDWGEARDWRGYDPYDGLNTPLAPALTLGRPLGRRLLTQAVKLSPLNLRPLLGIRPAWNAMAIAAVASGYARLAAAADAGARAPAERWLAWLVDHGEAGNGSLAWGYHFPVQTRVFAYARGTPNAIASSFAAHALLDGAELLEDERWLRAAERAGAFLVGSLHAAGAAPFFRYLPGEDELIHNANTLCCSVLARTATLGGADRSDVAAAALATTLRAQRPDGAWAYGERRAWVDNFHTGYVLESLAYSAPLGSDVRAALDQGLTFWRDRLFLDDGTPRYDLERTYPLDAQCFAQAVETWVALVPLREDARGEAERAARVLVERMVAPDGHVRFQRRRGWTSSVPYVRWSTAPTFRALAGVLLTRAR